MSSHCPSPSRSGKVAAANRQPHLLQHLHFVQSLETVEGGGLGRAAFELHESFLNQDIGSLLVTTSGDNSPQLLPATLEYARAWPSRAFFSPTLAREARGLIEDADILHGHGFYAGTNWLLGRSSRRRKKPLVYHPHGCFNPAALQCGRWRKRIAHWFFENGNFRSARLWRALTGHEANEIRQQGIRAPIVVAPNGIRLEPFDNVTPSPFDKTRRRILFLNRIHPANGIDLLLHAWNRLASVHPDWELVLAGPDENEYLRDLRSLASGLGLEKSVTFSGPVTGSARVLLIKSADLFVLTSRSDRFPTTALESMACRVPVLLTKPCAFQELATLGGGYECEVAQKDIERKLAEALTATDEERRQRGESGRRLVETRFSWPAISKTILEACEEHCR